ncbi:hypothetical protein NPIL_553791 [Nephila pilipes]|uniref:Uncharacterized protein n=1 Tax=Nephila pilipes TaxID=299642 RepID=A0A8X6Q7D0_NEPPI|nr:hypothetical protein NPIL_553791 [Nephila pilipes]
MSLSKTMISTKQDNGEQLTMLELDNRFLNPASLLSIYHPVSFLFLRNMFETPINTLYIRYIYMPLIRPSKGLFFILEVPMYYSEDIFKELIL